MTIVEMLGQSGVLSLLGMGIVFGFLIIMVVTITLMGKIVGALSPDKGATAPAGTTAPAAGAKASAGNNAQITAAIAAAVNEYRKSK